MCSFATLCSVLCMGPYLPCIQPNWCNRTLELFEWPDLRETKVMDEACKWLQANPTVWENWLPDATKCFPQFGLYNRASAPWALKLERKVISFRLQFLSTKTSAKPPVWWEVQKYTWHKSKRGVEPLDLWGLDGYKWFMVFSTILFFVECGAETSHGLNPSFWIWMD